MSVLILAGTDSRCYSFSKYYLDGNYILPSGVLIIDSKSVNANRIVELWHKASSVKVQTFIGRCEEFLPMVQEQIPTDTTVACLLTINSYDSIISSLERISFPIQWILFKKPGFDYDYGEIVGVGGMVLPQDSSSWQSTKFILQALSPNFSIISSSTLSPAGTYCESAKQIDRLLKEGVYAINMFLSWGREIFTMNVFEDSNITKLSTAKELMINYSNNIEEEKFAIGVVGKDTTYIGLLSKYPRLRIQVVFTFKKLKTFPPCVPQHREERILTPPPSKPDTTTPPQPIDKEPIPQKENTQVRLSPEKMEILPGLESPFKQIQSYIMQLQQERVKRKRRLIQGILIIGESSVGKTTLLETLQKAYPEALLLRAIDFTGLSDDELKRRVLEVSAEGSQREVSLLLIDDIDCICGCTENKSYFSPEITTFVNLWISLFDERQDAPSIIILIATTKSAETLPQQLKSKFMEYIRLQLPSAEVRRRFIEEWLMHRINLSTSQLQRIVDNTNGYNYRALESLCQKILLPQTPQDTDQDTDKLISEALQNTEPTTQETKLEFLQPLNFEQIGGYEEIVAELKKIADRFKKRELYERYNIKPPKGILFYGPPGTGKTYLARAFSSLLGYKCIKVDSEKIGSPYVYQAEQNLAQVFDIAKDYAPVILVMDELESLARRRGRDQSEAYEGVTTVLLRHLDGLDVCGDIFIIGITNMKDSIDPAVLRAGRLGKHIEVNLPDEKSRRSIFNTHIKEKRMKLADDVNLDELVGISQGFNCADIAEIVNDAAASVVDEINQGHEKPILTQNHFLAALKRLKRK